MEKEIHSFDIDNGLVDTYGLFDLTELSCGVDEGETQHFEEQGCVFGKDENGRDIFVECEINFEKVVEFMAEVGARYFEKEIAGLKLKVKKTYSPRYYNYTTDSCVWEVVESPFDTIEELVKEMKKVVLDDRDELNDDYRGNMYEELDNFMYENITSYDICGKTYTYNEVIEKFGGKL